MRDVDLQRVQISVRIAELQRRSLLPRAHDSVVR